MTRAAADQQHVCELRVEIDQEIAVRTVLILADARLGQLRAPEQGEAAVAKGDDFGQRGFGRPPVLGVGIDDHAMLVMGEFDAAALEIGKAVENVAAVEVGPARHRPGQEAAVAGGRREEEDFLPRRQDLGPSRSGKNLGSHGPSANTKRSARDALARRERTSSRRRRVRRRCARLANRCRRCGRTARPGSGPSAAPSARRSRARKGRADPVEVDHRKAPRHFGLRQELGRKAELPVRGDAVVQERLLGREEEQDAGGNEDRQARRSRSAPSIAAAMSQRHPGVDRVLAVGGAGQAGFAARRGAAVRRATSVDQRDTMAGAKQMMRGPGAEHARADHGDMSFMARL